MKVTYCHECAYYKAVATCVNSKRKGREVGYFQKACYLFRGEALPELRRTPAKDVHICRTCGRELPYSAFPRNRWGVMSVCRECRNAKIKKTMIERNIRPD